MKKALLSLATVALAGTLSAAQLVEAIVIRVGDRVVTRTQYLKRLHDGYNEIEQTAQAADMATKKEEFRKNLANDLISELREISGQVNRMMSQVDRAIHRLGEHAGEPLRR